jgi:hypothetical protein
MLPLERLEALVEQVLAIREALATDGPGVRSGVVG